MAARRRRNRAAETRLVRSRQRSCARLRASAICRTEVLDPRRLHGANRLPSAILSARLIGNSGAATACAIFGCSYGEPVPRIEQDNLPAGGARCRRRHNTAARGGLRWPTAMLPAALSINWASATGRAGASCGCQRSADQNLAGVRGLTRTASPRTRCRDPAAAAPSTAARSQKPVTQHPLSRRNTEAYGPMAIPSAHVVTALLTGLARARNRPALRNSM